MARHKAPVGRCTIVEFDEYIAYRCRLRRTHMRGGKYVLVEPCEFVPSGDQELCLRRSTNLSTGLTRYCALPREHRECVLPDPCIFLFYTERQATRSEMRLPVVTAP